MMRACSERCFIRGLATTPCLIVHVYTLRAIGPWFHVALQKTLCFNKNSCAQITMEQATWCTQKQQWVFPFTVKC